MCFAWWTALIFAAIELLPAGIGCLGTVHDYM